MSAQDHQYAVGRAVAAARSMLSRELGKTQDPHHCDVCGVLATWVGGWLSYVNGRPEDFRPHTWRCADHAPEVYP